MSGTKIIKCTRKHAYQDRHQRVHNIMDGSKEARCTVCSKVKET